MITHTCPVCDRQITKIDNLHWGFCYHGASSATAKNGRYGIRINDNSQIDIVQVYISRNMIVVQLPLKKETQIRNLEGKTLLHLHSLFHIDYKNIPKLKEKLSTYLVFS